jgi:flagellar basal-body rod protein FlgB
MIPGVDNDPMLQLLARAMDAAVLRQSAHSSNIANADSIDYQRVEVAFEELLDGLVDGSGRLMPGATAPRPEIVVAVDPEIRLDREMALLAENAMHYQALLTVFERSYGSIRLAIREGRQG